MERSGMADRRNQPNKDTQDSLVFVISVDQHTSKKMDSSLVAMVPIVMKSMRSNYRSQLQYHNVPNVENIICPQMINVSTRALTPWVPVAPPICERIQPSSEPRTCVVGPIEGQKVSFHDDCLERQVAYMAWTIGISR
jgi:hypothetical protein